MSVVGSGWIRSIFAVSPGYKRRKHRLVLLLFLLLPLLLSGCSVGDLDAAKDLLESGDFLGARAIYESIYTSRPQSMEAHYGAAMSWCAEAIYREDLGMGSVDYWFPAIYHMTIAYSLAETKDDVRPLLAILHFNLGTYYSRNEDSYAAIERLEQAVVYDSTLLKAFNLLGALYQQEGDLDNAERCYLRALVIEPEYAKAHFNLGALAWAQKDYSASAEHFQRAQALSPENEHISQWLLRAREKAGEN